MNILTKICVVILLVLVLVASVVFINMATVPQNYRAAYNQEKDRATLNAQAVRLQKLVSGRQAAEIADLKAGNDRLAAQLADVKKGQVPSPEELRTAELKTAIDAANTRLAELQLNVDAMSARNERLGQQLDESRKSIATLQAQNQRDTAELTQARGSLERSERVVRTLERQLQDREERIAELEKMPARGAAAAGATDAAPIASAQGKVTGTITAVRGEFASINVGAAQGVARGQKLYIYRNASFVGYLRVDEVDQGQAGGAIIDKQLDPAVGDKVTNDLLK